MNKWLFFGLLPGCFWVVFFYQRSAALFGDRRHRWVPSIFSDNNKLGEKFYRLLADEDARLRVYVYPYRNNRCSGDAVYRGEPFERLLDYLRDEFGTAEYYVMIRRGRRMELAGVIAIEAPLNWRKRT